MFDGSIIVGAQTLQSPRRFPGSSPEVQPENGFSSAGQQDVMAAALLAEGATRPFGDLSPEKRAVFLETIADEILAIGDTLISSAMAETGLSRARLENERGRTMNQLRLFATELRQGRWLDATIDTALPDRTPPRPDLRRVNRPIGPVAVFGASNFPLAFSVAGGDTASALAAGCPVIVKGHPAHPATGELVARAIQRAVMSCDLPPGTFSYLPGDTHDLGHALVAEPRVQAVGFTGSRAGGLALLKTAARRPQPIPVFAEMSAVNPVVLLPAALERRAEEIATAFVASMTLGAGQFCTNPGLVIAVAGPPLDRFLATAAAATSQSASQPMLSPAIRAGYIAGVATLAGHNQVTSVATGRTTGSDDAPPALFLTDAAAYLADAALGEEVFGATSLVVRAADEAELEALVAAIQGQLTFSLHCEPGDAPLAARLLPMIEAKAGRVLANGWPTGVEVSPAMVHGGPYPATSDTRSTSVGTLAIARFLRPVCYQDMPDDLLPAALQASNPWRLPRRVNAERETI